MAQRRISQEGFGFASARDRHSSLDELQKRGRLCAPSTTTDYRI